MIDLGHGRIYLNKGEPMPLGCPECFSPLPYTKEQVVTCRDCGFTEARELFLDDVAWQLGAVN